MTLEIFFKIAFFIILFSFAYVMTFYTKKAKSRREAVSARVQMHHEHEVPLLLRLLIEQFGNQYRDYMQRTGAFLPKITK